MDEPLWSFPAIAAAIGAAPSPPCDGLVSGISIDSRTLSPGDLFVAIKGDRTDGHRFVDTAFERGAAAAIVAADFTPSSVGPGPLFYVPDTLEALNALGRTARARSSAAIVAVTGSVGKTGTKEMLRSMLTATGPTHGSEKSYNNLWGVPLSLSRMPRSAAFGVFEIGMNHAGEIIPLSRLVRPHIAIITWVAPVHIEFFDSVAAIAVAKSEIFEGLEQGGTAILPLDNPHIGTLAGRAHAKGARVVTFGESEGADARLLRFDPLEPGSRVAADILGSEVIFFLASPGRHLALNAIAALAAVKLSGANLPAAAEALGQFEVPQGRGHRTAFATSEGPVLIIDETYNANPESMRAALQVMGATPRDTYGRRIVVLGDMLELGHAAPEYHAGLASVIDSNAIDLVFCAGRLMAHLYERIPLHRRGGLCATSEDLCPYVLDTVRGGDAVMIKGSLGSRMGQLAEALRSRFAEVTASNGAATRVRG